MCVREGFFRCHTWSTKGVSSPTLDLKKKTIRSEIDLRIVRVCARFCLRLALKAHSDLKKKHSNMKSTYALCAFVQDFIIIMMCLKFKSGSLLVLSPKSELVWWRGNMRKVRRKVVCLHVLLFRTTEIWCRVECMVMMMSRWNQQHCHRWREVDRWHLNYEVVTEGGGEGCWNINLIWA